MLCFVFKLSKWLPDIRIFWRILWSILFYRVYRQHTVYSVLHIPLWSNIKCTGAYRYDGEHGVSLRVSEQDVDEGDDLQRFSQAHAVSEDAAESAAAAEPLHRLHQVVVQEADSTDLKRRWEGKKWRMKRQDKEKREGEIKEGRGWQKREMEPWR